MKSRCWNDSKYCILKNEGLSRRGSGEGDDGEWGTRAQKTLAMCPVCMLAQYASLLA